MGRQEWAGRVMSQREPCCALQRERLRHTCYHLQRCRVGDGRAVQ
jgi:hypothetical protein